MKNKYIYIVVFFLTFSALTAQNFVVSNLSNINSSYDDFAPSWNNFQQKLYFNSDRSGISKLYVCSKDSSLFSTPVLLKGGLNSGKNISYISFENSKFAYLTAYCSKKERSYINIFKTEFEKNTWGKAYLVEELTSNSFCGFPAISPSGKLMIFSSNQNSENKELDLLFSVQDNQGNWSTPTLLTELNTPGNEISPFFISEDSLVYASDGMEGPGKYDLYTSVKQDGIWQTPEPMSSLNSEFNEFGFTKVSEDEYIFSSDRPGGLGNLDLYKCIKSSNNSIPIQDYEDIELNIEAQTTILRALKEAKTLLAYASNSLQSLTYDDNYFFDRLVKSNKVNFNSFAEYTYDSTFSIIPSKLEITLNGGPSELISNWVLKLVAESDTFILNRGNTFPFSTTIDLKEYLSSFIKIDSAVLVLDAFSQNNNLFSERYLLNINKSTTSGLGVAKDEDGNSKTILISTDLEIYDNIINEINNQSVYSQKIVIEYYSEKNKEFASLIKKAINSKQPRKQIILKSVAYTDNQKYSKVLSENIIKIKLIIN